jgi:hypothetical protein
LEFARLDRQALPTKIAGANLLIAGQSMETAKQLRQPPLHAQG